MPKGEGKEQSDDRIKESLSQEVEIKNLNVFALTFQNLKEKFTRHSNSKGGD